MIFLTNLVEPLSFQNWTLRAGTIKSRFDLGMNGKMTFKTWEGLFKWLVMPFGLSNAPSIFMQVMNQVLHLFIGKFVVVYFDDILIYSSSEKLHLQHLREVLLVLRRDKFYAASKKCEFGTDNVPFLGYIVSKNGLAVDPAKVESIWSWPIPCTVSEIRSFHGLASFYHCFIPHFSSLMALVTDCIRNRKFMWSTVANNAFKFIKRKLTTAPILVLPDFSLTFELHSDVSKVGIGIVLSQQV